MYFDTIMTSHKHIKVQQIIESPRSDCVQLSRACEPLEHTWMVEEEAVGEGAEGRTTSRNMVEGTEVYTYKSRESLQQSE